MTKAKPYCLQQTLRDKTAQADDLVKELQQVRAERDQANQ